MERSEACASICVTLYMPLTEIRLSLLPCFESKSLRLVIRVVIVRLITQPRSSELPNVRSAP